MSIFVNTVDSIGDEALTSSIIDRSITEIQDNYATSIGVNAFYNCPNLTAVNFPTVISIGESAFYNCTALTTADFPVATSIGDVAFQNCSALTAVNFPTATSIGNSTFQNCTALMTADFPVATSIDSYAFYSCDNLTALILRSATMATLSGPNAFTFTPINSGTGYIYVPAALVDSYKADSVWSTFAGQIRAIEDYPEICG